MNKSICAVTLASLISLTACGGGSGSSAGTASGNTPNNTANPTTPAAPGNTDQDTVVSGTPGLESPAESGASEQPAEQPAEQPTNPTSVANNDTYTTASDKPVKVDAETGVMSNDAVDIEQGQVSIVSEPSHGQVMLEVNGAFSYTPDSGFSGVDSFDYAVVDSDGQEAVATVTVTVTEPEVVDNGFTPIIASDDTVTVYVSSSEGLDSNDGFSINAPVKTLDKAFSLVRDGHPDHVLLKRGDVWVDENLNKIKSGRSEAEPAVVAFYGESGGRPRIEASGVTINSNGFQHVHIMGLEIEAYKLNPKDHRFDGETSANIRMVGDFKDILFEDLKLRFIEFVIQDWDGKAPTDIHIRRTMVLDKYTSSTSYNRDSRPSGVYTDGGDGFVVEESLWDHNGWNADVPGAGANMYNHNMYISEKGNIGNKIAVRNNIITRGSALGVHGRPGGLYENNFFGRNPIGLQMGYFLGPELQEGTIAYARNNVVTEGLNMNRGIDACADAKICTGAIWGIQVENLGNADVRVEGNIVSNRLFEHEGYVSGIRQEDQAVYNDNIVYRWESEDQGADQNYPDPNRTLASYNASLGGEQSFEAFIEAARNRGLQEWDERYTADAVNDYIRAGFGREAN